MAAELTQRLMESLDDRRRQIVEAIVCRSAHEDATAQLLDRALALVHVGAEGAVGTFLTVLELGVVYVLMREPDDWSSLLVLEDAGGRSHMAVFSSGAHAEAAVQRFGAAYQSTPIDVVLFCECLDGEIGLAINPHDEALSFELSPEIFHRFQDAVFAHGEPEAGAYYSVLEGARGYQCLHVQEVGEMIVAEAMTTEWPIRPRSLSLRMCEGLRREPRSMDRESFQGVHPLRIMEIGD